MPDGPRRDAPLHGVRVVDLTHFVAGPWATMILADLGAEVVKVEPPAGEIGRSVGAVYAAGHSAIFLGFNRSKRSIVVDLKQPGGREVVARLTAGADCVIENFRPGTAARLGVDYDTLAADNPRLVGCSLSAFGEGGPYAARPANDPIVQGITGAMSESGDPDGTPLRMGVSVPDFAGAVTAALAIVCALHERERTGRGSHIATSLLDTQLFSQLDRVVWQRLEPCRPAGGDDRFSLLTRRALTCADGQHLVVAADDEGSWTRLASALGRPDLALPPLLEDATQAVAAVADAVRTRDLPSWLEVLAAADVPAAAASGLGDVFGKSGPGRAMVGTVQHPDIGELSYVRTPTGRPDLPPVAPPRLGEHTLELLDELGYDEAEQQQLLGTGVVRAR